MTPGDASLRHYAREIERCWSELSDRPIVLSPRDFRLLADWCDREVPLDVIREALAEARDRRRDRQAPQRLSAIAPIVEESWKTMIEGRVARRPTAAAVLVERAAAADAGESPLEAWRRRARSESTPAALRDELTRCLTQIDDGADPAQVDASLESRLVTLIAPSIENEVRRAVEDRLASYRDRLTPAAFAAARTRALAAARRRALGVPRLSAAGEPSSA